MYLCEESNQLMQKNSNFDIFESALFEISEYAFNYTLALTLAWLSGEERHSHLPHFNLTAIHVDCLNKTKCEISDVNQESRFRLDQC